MGRPGHLFTQPQHRYERRLPLAAGCFLGEMLFVPSRQSGLAMPQLLRHPRAVMHSLETPTTQQADSVIGPLLGFIVPGLVGVALVGVLFIFKPDAIYSSDQMAAVNKLEKEVELKRRGTINLDDKPESRSARRRKARQKR